MSTVSTVSKLVSKVNGPTNLVKMEGMIGSVKKVIYLFMDYHFEDVEDQTDSGDPNSINIVNYLKTNLNNPNRLITYDFFLEAFPSKLVKGYEETIFSQMLDDELTYIESVKKFFYQNIKVDSQMKIKSNIPNVRFHYIDIKDRMIFLTTEPLEYLMKRLTDALHDENREDMINDMATCIEDMLQIPSRFLWNVRDLLVGDDYFPEKYGNILDSIELYPGDYECYEYYDYDTDTKILDKLSKQTLYVLDKTVNRYHNLAHKKIIDKIFIEPLVETINAMMLELDTAIEHHSTLDLACYLDDVFIRATKKRFKQYFDEILDIIGKLNNLIFIRRFIDKEYINHAIIYLGQTKCLTCMKLFKNLGMKIITVAKSTVDTETLNKKCLEYEETEHYNEIEELFGINPDTEQFIDVSAFPKYFL